MDWQYAKAQYNLYLKTINIKGIILHFRKYTYWLYCQQLDKSDTTLMSVCQI